MHAVSAALFGRPRIAVLCQVDALSLEIIWMTLPGVAVPNDAKLPGVAVPNDAKLCGGRGMECRSA